MVDRLRDEAGTTLTELLVVMVVLGVIGSVTTVGIVTGFRAQLDSTNVAETLDGMRIATQRVRDFVRAGSEVCAKSTENQLRLWSDHNGDGNVQDTEIDIFEVVGPVGDTVFQRRSGSGDVVQLIRDDIIDGTVFRYDPPLPENQADLRCHDDVTPGTGQPVRRVDVLFSVEHPEPGQDPLETSTSVRLRNANLAEPSRNKPPKASFTVSCPNDDLICHFDGFASSDPEDETVSFYSWEIIDPDNDTVVHTEAGKNADTFSHPFTTGGDRDYDVLLTVTDSDGAPDSTGGIAHPVEPGSNPPPVAEFTVTCAANSCDFDASASSDNTTIVSYDWDFGDGLTGQGETITHPYADGTYTVTLTVTDDGDPDDPEVEARTGTKTLTLPVGTNVFYVSKMSGIKSGSGNDRVATISTQLTLTAGGDPGAGLVITIRARDTKDGLVGDSSCTTNSSGNCSVAFNGLKGSSFPITATVEEVTHDGSYKWRKEHPDSVTEVTIQ